MTRATRAIRWTAVLAAFVLPGVALGLGVAGWTLYGLVALALLGRYRDMQARIAAGEPDAALFTPEEVQAALDRPAPAAEDTTDRTFYPAGSRELQWMAYHAGKDIHPDDYKHSSLHNPSGPWY